MHFDNNGLSECIFCVYFVTNFYDSYDMQRFSLQSTTVNFFTNYPSE